MVESIQNMAKEIKRISNPDLIILEKYNGISEEDINFKAYCEFEEAGEIKDLNPETFLAFINGLFIGMDHTLPGLYSREEIENSPDVVFIKQAHDDSLPFEIRGEKFIENQN